MDHDLLDRVLTDHVNADGLVDYRRLKEHADPLKTYVDSLRIVSPVSAPERYGQRADALAYWINAYNALVLHSIVEAYPVSSVESLGGLDTFFRKRQHVVGGESLTLDAIENQIIRPQYSDARIHFAVNCGARSCPALDSRAYRGSDLSAHLDRQARRFAADPQHLTWHEGGLMVSKLLAWYREDFTGVAGDDTELIAFLKQYAPADLSHQFKPGVPIRYFDYDWGLNEQPVEDRPEATDSAP